MDRSTSCPPCSRRTQRPAGGGPPRCPVGRRASARSWPPHRPRTARPCAAPRRTRSCARRRPPTRAGMRPDRAPSADCSRRPGRSAQPVRRLGNRIRGLRQPRHRRQLAARTHLAGRRRLSHGAAGPRRPPLAAGALRQRRQRPVRRRPDLHRQGARVRRRRAALARPRYAGQLRRHGRGIGRRLDARRGHQERAADHVRRRRALANHRSVMGHGLDRRRHDRGRRRVRRHVYRAVRAARRRDRRRPRRCSRSPRPVASRRGWSPSRAMRTSSTPTPGPAGSSPRATTASRGRTSTTRPDSC